MAARRRTAAGGCAICWHPLHISFEARANEGNRAQQNDMPSTARHLWHFGFKPVVLAVGGAHDRPTPLSPSLETPNKVERVVQQQIGTVPAIGRWWSTQSDLLNSSSSTWSSRSAHPQLPHAHQWTCRGGSGESGSGGSGSGDGGGGGCGGDDGDGQRWSCVWARWQPHVAAAFANRPTPAGLGTQPDATRLHPKTLETLPY